MVCLGERLLYVAKVGGNVILAPWLSSEIKRRIATIIVVRVR